MFNMGRSRDMNTPIMITVIGVGLGVAAYSMMKGRNNNGNNQNMMQPIERVMDELRN